MPKLRYTIGGVAIPAQRTSWAFTPGMAPYSLSINLPRPRAKAVMEAVGRADATLSLRTRMLGFDGGPVDVKMNVDQVRVLFSDGTASPWEATISMVDRRWWLDRETVWGNFNLRRQTNDKGVVGQESPFATASRAAAGIPLSFSQIAAGLLAIADAAVALTVGNNADQRFNKETYLPWTIHANGKPYTAKEIAVALCKYGVFVKAKAAALALEIAKALDPLPDNGYIPDAQQYTGNVFIPTIQQLLVWAELQVALAPDGTVYAYSSRAAGATELLEKITPFYPTIAAGGFVDVLERSAIRPAKVVVATPSESDVEFLLVEGGFSKPRALECENVLQLPQDITYQGKTYRKGTWVEVSIALAAWSTELPLSGNPYSRPTLNLARVCDLWFPSGKLAIAYTMVLEAGGFKTSATWGPRIASLMQHFRQTWRINPAVNQFILNWFPRRTSIVDAVSRTYAKPWVSVDHCVIPKVTLPEFKRRRGRAGTNIAAVTTGPLTTPVGAPYDLRFLDAPLGVFRVDPDGGALVGGNHIQTVVPSQVDGLPVLAAAALDAHISWHHAKLKRTYGGRVVFAVQWGLKPEHFIDSRDVDKGCEGDRQSMAFEVEVSAGWTESETDEEIFVAGATNSDLGFALTDRTVTRSESTDGRTTNIEIVKDVATSAARRIYDPLADGIGGTFEVPGYVDAYRLFGTMQGITVNVGQRGRVTTVFRLAPGQAPRDMLELVNPATRAYLARELPRGQRGADSK